MQAAESHRPRHHLIATPWSLNPKGERGHQEEEPLHEPLNCHFLNLHASAFRQGTPNAFSPFSFFIFIIRYFTLLVDREISLHFLHALRHPSFDPFLTEPVPTQRIPHLKVETNHFPIGQDQTFSKGKLRG